MAFVAYCNQGTHREGGRQKQARGTIKRWPAGIRNQPGFPREVVNFSFKSKQDDFKLGHQASYQGTSSIVKVRGSWGPTYNEASSTSVHRYYTFEIYQNQIFWFFYFYFFALTIRSGYKLLQIQKWFWNGCFWIWMLSSFDKGSFVAKGVVCGPSISKVIFHAFRQKHWGI